MTELRVFKEYDRMKELTFTIFCTLMLFLMLSLTQNKTFVEAVPNTIKVPQQCQTIQEAINHATEGDTIQISPKTYLENIIVNKTVSIIGENRTTTIIDGNGAETVIYIKANNVLISGFTVQNSSNGIWLYYSQNCVINDTDVIDNFYGIKLYHSSNSTISRNNICNNEQFGIVLDCSGNCTFRNNNLSNNNYNFGVDGATVFDFVNDIDTSNTLGGKPIYYLLNQNNITVDSSTFPQIGYLAFVNSTNISVEDLTLTSNKQGVLFAYTSNSTINNINTANNWNGIYLKGSWNCEINGNNASNNFDYGIAIRLSGNCTISKNDVKNNSWGGISLGLSWNSTIVKNNVTNSYYGIHLVDSTNCLVIGNNVSPSNSGYSIVIYRAYDNVIYHNNFVNYFIYEYGKSNNIWDNGLEGNYWTEYTGLDADQDGIGDTPHGLAGNEDQHPLMGTFYDFLVSYKEKTYNVIIVSNSTISNFSFETATENELKTISFNVTGPDDAMGFCRIMIPHTLMDGNYTILIDGSQILHRRLLCSNNTNSYLYFTYFHTKQKVVIVPEFPCTLIIPLAIALVSIMAIVKKPKRVHS